MDERELETNEPKQLQSRPDAVADMLTILSEARGGKPLSNDEVNNLADLLNGALPQIEPNFQPLTSEEIHQAQMLSVAKAVPLKGSSIVQ